MSKKLIIEVYGGKDKRKLEIRGGKLEVRNSEM
jgi:hypothetical protein